MNGTRTSEGGKQAVVLSGGGADGAYGVGVLKALFSAQSPATGYEPLDPEIFAGTSIGSFNASFLVSRWDELGLASIADLEGIWLDRLSQGKADPRNGVYRFRADPRELLDPRCYLPNPALPLLRFAGDTAAVGWEGLQRLVHFATAHDSLMQRSIELVNFSTLVSRQPWAQTIRDTIDFSHIRRSSRILRIAATNWTTGSLKIFNNGEMSDSLGPLAIEGSSALPGFFPPANVGAQPFIDGSVLLNTPLKPAIRAGGQHIFVIYLDPDVSVTPLAHVDNTLETLYRAQQIVWAAKVTLDIEMALRINRTLAWIEQARAAGDTQGPLFEQMARTHSRFLRLTIHRFSPREDLGGAAGLLDLNRERVDRLIRLGFQDTLDHDCQEAGCVLMEEEAQ